jgi:hypothetical protein
MRSFISAWACFALLIIVFLGSAPSLSAQYCKPAIDPGWGCDGAFSISSVQVGSFLRQSLGTAGCYDDQSGTSITVFRQTPIDVEVNATQAGTVTTWVDLDADGIFAANELVDGPSQIVQSWSWDPFGNFVLTTEPVRFRLNLPCTMPIGQTRIRFMFCFPFSSTDPCMLVGLGEVEDYTLNVVGDMVRSFPDDAPDASAVLQKGQIYDGSSASLPQPSVTLRTNNVGQQIPITYTITGPLPLTTVQYRASFVAVTSTIGEETFPVFNATGALAGMDGALDTRTATGGEYALHVSIPSTGELCATEWSKNFTIALQRDVSTRDIRSPRTNGAPGNYRYPNTSPIPVVAVFMNTGLDTLRSFKGIARLYDPSGAQIYTDEQPVLEKLAPGARTTINFANFTSTSPNGHPVGVYSASVCAEIVDPSPDEINFNNCLPRPGQPAWNFEIQYLEEPAVLAVNVPSTTQTLFANRPLRPEALFANNGIQDLSDVRVSCTIYRLPNRQVVYTQTGIVPDIAAGQFNRAIYTFPAFTPTDAAQYDFCFSVNYPGDPIASNNSICVRRTVEGNLSGIYTIGTTQPGARNYTTIDAALDDLYRKGVSGPVTFQLTDAQYTVQRTGADVPGIDLSSRIIGVSATNTILFTPSLTRSLTRAGVTIRVETESGIGVLFGQNATPSNSNAIQQQQYFASAENARSAGYITFDGGTQRSLRFQLAKRSLPTSTTFNVGIYLSQGSTHHTVKNTIIDVAPDVAPHFDHTLPVVRYNAGSNAFRFDPDVRTGNVSYTVGILSRDTISTDNRGNLDTIPNAFNTFSGNEISGFGYGIASMGLGALIKGNNFKAYYNTGTQITNNTIHTVARAGIYVGYEDGAVISGNRIYNVGRVATNTSVNDAAGIMAGGESRYNNVDLTIARNEISGVVGNTFSRGIVVDQARTDYQSVLASGGIISFPDRAEHTMITSNVVWGLSRGTSAASMAGIHLTTLRATSTDPVTALLTPSIGSYFTQQDTIANNTVLMQNDNVVGSGAVAGIATQQGNGTTVINNAVAMLGARNAATLAHAAILYEGTLFRGTRYNTGYLPATAPAALLSNRNAVWAPNASIARFIEVTHTGQIVSTGSDDEFANVAQWRTWTGQDVHSLVADWTADVVFTGVAPEQKLRIRTTPSLPKGSVLNNTGVRIASIGTDIDGNTRGGAGLGYDIGASEFNGQMYGNDNAVVTILTPSAYRRTSGATSDAEYIMTKAPVDVTAQVQNVGSLASASTKVRVQIYRETAASNNSGASPAQFGATPVADRTVMVNMNSGEIKTVDFDIPNWTPDVYAGMNGYTVPSRFAAMALNVTPLYRIDVSVQSDENGANNVVSKTVRFYLQRSQMSVLLSARNANVDIHTGAPTTTVLAGRLNADTAIKAFTTLGWTNNAATNNFAYDVFDRSAWEERAVEYSLYRTVFWSHDNTAFTRGERDDLRNFLAAGTTTVKKNLAVYSQEPARRHVGLDPVNDEYFVRSVLRSTNVAPGTPVPAPPVTASYHNKHVIGAAIARNATELIARTGVVNDEDPIPALVRVYSDATTSGIANSAFFYPKADRTTIDSVMGVATASLTSNVVSLGVDWRHFARTRTGTGIERVLRGTVDFFESNGGTVVPVELTLFDAKARGSNVDVFWSTASEKNTDHFTVERASVSEAGIAAADAFTHVATVVAAGNSTKHIDYRHTDVDVTPGKYLYRLTSVDADGSSTQSDEVQVTIEGGKDDLQITDLLPNPMSANGTVGIVLPTAGDVTLTLYNTSGTEVLTLINGQRTAGRHNVPLSTTQLPVGSYRLVLRQGDRIRSAILTVMR